MKKLGIPLGGTLALTLPQIGEGPLLVNSKFEARSRLGYPLGVFPAFSSAFGLFF